MPVPKAPDAATDANNAPVAAELPAFRPLGRRPGNVVLAAKDSNFSGVLFIEFENVEQINDYFTKTAGLMLIEWKPRGNHGITAAITNTLDDEEREIFMEASKLLHGKMDELRAERAARKNAEVEAVDVEYARLSELAKKGEHCLANHGKFIKKERE
jgi:hypothetical protein